MGFGRDRKINKSQGTTVVDLPKDQTRPLSFDAPEGCYHHGGRRGDLIFAMYTMMKLGKADVILSNYHTPGWDEADMDQMIPLLEYQDYVGKVHKAIIPDGDELHNFRINQIIPERICSKINYDLRSAEDDYNPQLFPDWNKMVWPGNANIQKRYAYHFCEEVKFGEPWLKAPAGDQYDVVFHAPHRRLVHSASAWVAIIDFLVGYGLKIIVLTGKHDRDDWNLENIMTYTPADMLETASLIKSCKVFVGAVSSVNAIAEGLNKRRYVERSLNCDNVYTEEPIGTIINDWTIDRLMAELSQYKR